MKERKPVLIVIAGPNGSGKTTLTEQVIRHQWAADCIYINPDLIAQNQFGDWNSADAVLRAAQYAERLREECLSQKKSLAFETVLSACDKVDFVRRAKDQGFFVRMFFVSTDHPSINASRVANRILEGGHDVPIPKIISRYSKSIANCAALVGEVDRCYVYDNSIDGEQPRLIFKTIDGKVAKFYTGINSWAQSIANCAHKSDSHDEEKAQQRTQPKGIGR